MKTISPNPDQIGALPVYVQIAELIAREISAGHLVQGERLPTERAMARQYDVAVGTLRKALARLTDQGLLERRQGSGNYVKSGAESGSLYAFFRLELPGGGGLPSAKLLSLDRMEKPGDLPEFGKSSIGFRFRRLRYLDDSLAALEEIWLDGSVTKSIDPAHVSQSLYHFYKEKLGLWITRAEDWVSIAKLPDWGIHQFPIQPESSVGFMERFGWAQNGQNIEYSRNWFDPTRVRYVARLK